ncbi:hypothetical protein F2P81_003385 [Scophthalmus maximus]|uniref:Uncharacterized protein n=1 Tax=Scophthalmus maximus TaxID=52904 RepID=A0A6A4TCK7_SCOMX|nr:hypothetical protein F2P81_003385 [Scophthalmus maximus]
MCACRWFGSDPRHVTASQRRHPDRGPVPGRQQERALVLPSGAVGGMNSEETNVELRVAETKDAEAEPKDAAEPPAQDAADADATEADVSEADLDQEEQEKQPKED